MPAITIGYFEMSVLLLFFFDTRLDKTSGIHKRFGNNALVFIQQWKLSEATVSPVCNFATHQQTVKLV